MQIFSQSEVMTNEWGNQCLDEVLHSGDSGIRDISNYPLIFCDLGCTISPVKKFPQKWFAPFATFGRSALGHTLLVRQSWGPSSMCLPAS